MGEAMHFSVKVRHYEADGYGHVNHASYVHYLETARVEALEAVGLSLPREMRGARTLWIQAVSEATTGPPVVTAEVTGAFLAESGKPLRIPPSFREKLAALHVSEEPER